METAQSYLFDNAKVHPKITTRIYNLRNSISYQICTYNEDYLCVNESKDVTQCRSVIKSYPEGQLLSFSPPRKSTLQTVIQEIHGVSPRLFLNEFIEGLLIHLFYEPRTASWEIATKNAVGGHYPLDKDDRTPTATEQKSDNYIRAIFCKAFACDSLQEIPCFEWFSKDHSYNFILNPIDLQNGPDDFAIQRIYLIGVYEINSGTNRAIYVKPHNYMHWVCFQNTPILFPDLTEYNLSNKIDEEYLEEYCIERNLDGVVLHNTQTALHYVHKSRSLKEKHATSRMDAAMFFRFLSLKQAGVEADYLETYPTHKKRFGKFHALYHNTVTSIYNHYSAFYIRKTLNSMSPKYKYYTEELHRRYYLSSLAKKDRKSVTKRVVYDYFATLSPSQQLYACFYEQRSTQ